MNIIKSKSDLLNWKQKNIVFMLIALILVNLLLYISTINYDFLKDDFRLIVENPRIKDVETFFNSIGSKFFSFPDFPYLHYWRPLTLFSFYIDYQIWELNASGYHLANIILNTLNGVLIFGVVYLLFSNIYYALMSSIFFSIHPSHVEAVSWISGRTDLLAAFFVFSSLFFFILYIKRRKILFYLITILLFTCGLLSKENAALLPFFITGLIIFFPSQLPSKISDKHKIKKDIALKLLITLPFWILEVVYILFHNHFSGVNQVIKNFSIGDIFIIMKTIGAYTRVIFFPFFSSPHFSMNYFDENHILFFVYFIIALLFLVLLIFKRRHYKYSLFSLLFLIFLIPVLDPELVPSYPKIVNRFAYIPVLIVGIFLMDTFYFIQDIQKKLNLKKGYLKAVLMSFLILMGGIWIYKTVKFQVYYKDQFSHYDGLIRYFPDDCSLLLPNALLHAQKGDYQQALNIVNTALEVNHKDRWLDISEMGGLLKANLLVVTKNYEKGKLLAEKIIGESNKDEMKYYGYTILAKYYEKKAQFNESLGMLKKAEEIGETADLDFRIAFIYAKMNNFDSALKYIELAIILNQSNQKYHEFKKFLLHQKMQLPNGDRN